MRVRALAVCAVVMGGLVLAPTATVAYPGDLDPLFGDYCGLKFVTIENAHGFGGHVVDVDVLPDGRTVAFMSGAWHGMEGGGFAAARLTADGKLDTEFGDNGLVVRNLGSHGSSPGAGAVTHDGKLLIAGWIFYESVSVLLRLTALGARDDTFGSNGVVALESGNVVALVAQADGSTLILGNDNIVKRTSSGALDQSFGSNGKYQDPVGGFNAVTVDERGKILLAAGLGTVARITRLTPQGALDPTWSGDGVSDTSLAPGATSAIVYSVNLDDHGRVVTAGVAASFGASDPSDGFLLRHLPNGSPDTALSGDGLVTDLIPDLADHTYDVVVGPGGTLTLVGDIESADTPVQRQVLLARLTESGQLDSHFGFAGFMVTDIGADELVRHAVATPDGDVVAAGSVSDGQGGTTGFFAKYRSNPGSGAPAGYVVDEFGSVQPIARLASDLPPCVIAGPDWGGWAIARGGVVMPVGEGGFVLDAWGGLHPYTPWPQLWEPPTVTSGPYWPGWDITRDAVLSNVTEPSGEPRGGYILDGWGGRHRFGLNGFQVAETIGGPYWPGWDIARGIAMVPGGGGFVLDGWGGLHPFGTPFFDQAIMPPTPNGGPYWPGWDIARGVTVLPDGSGGYILDGWGGLHPFGLGDNPPPPPLAHHPYTPGHDIAEGISLFPSNLGSPAAATGASPTARRPPPVLR